jgi:hypothetical protein
MSSDRRLNSVVLGLAVLALIAGALLLIAADGLGAMIAGTVLLGLGGIALVSLAFLIVGQGEDRDRTRHPQG